MSGIGFVQLNNTVLDEYPFTRRVDKNVSVKLEAIASTGYHFDYWSGDMEGSDNPTEINVGSGKTIMAHFIADAKEFSSGDHIVNLVVPEGTNIFDGESNHLDSVVFAVNDMPPSAPDRSGFVGSSYDLEPQGVTFDQPVTLFWSYDPVDIPEGAEEWNLSLAYYDENAGTWVELSSVVNSFYHTVTTSIEHFTTFAVIAAITELPASFDVSSLMVSPTETYVDEALDISVLLSNTGEATGSYTLDLKINGAIEDTKEVTLTGDSSETVTFTTTRNEAGTYTVDIDGVTTNFIVKQTMVNWFILGPVIAGVAVLLTFVVLRQKGKKVPILSRSTNSSS